jgi:hypothetical protein
VQELDPDRAAQLWQLSASLLAAANSAGLLRYEYGSEAMG